MNAKDCKNLEELFEYWKQKAPVKTESGFVINHQKDFITDGIVNRTEWDKLDEKKKVLFLLKEAYGEGECWSLTDYISGANFKRNTWNRIIEWSRGLQGTSKDSIISFSNDYDIYKASKNAPNEWLSKIAVMNIKKSGGKSYSDGIELHEYAEHDQEEIVREIELIDPDVVVCGYTFQYLFNVYNDTKKKMKNDNWYYYSEAIGEKERLFIDYYHPAAQYPALLLYYGLMNIYQIALRER